MTERMRDVQYSNTLQQARRHIALLVHFKRCNFNDAKYEISRYKIFIKENSVSLPAVSSGVSTLN